MGKIIAAMNMTLDGFCDHTAGIVDDELHEYYNDLLRGADVLMYGRKTYQLMEDYWPGLVKKPSGNKPMDDFAVLIDNIPKIVYSRTMTSVNWKNTTLKREFKKDELLALRQQHENVVVGSPGMIATLSGLRLIDEYKLCIHPIVLGSGLVLFRNITDRMDLNLTGTRTLGTGVIALNYALIRE